MKKKQKNKTHTDAVLRQVLCDLWHLRINLEDDLNVLVAPPGLQLFGTLPPSQMEIFSVSFCKL